MHYIVEKSKSDFGICFSLFKHALKITERTHKNHLDNLRLYNFTFFAFA